MSDKMTITVEGYDAAQVKDWLSQRITAEVGEDLNRRVNDAIRGAIKTRVDQLVDEVTKERVTKEIDAIFAEGWVQTDEWGNPRGQAKTLRDRVRGFFDSKEDSYARQTRVEKWIQETCGRTLDAITAEETKAYRERLRKAFDEVLQAKFTDTIRSALGLK